MGHILYFFILVLGYTCLDSKYYLRCGGVLYLNELGTLIIMLFNYNFKRCNYCNKYFYPKNSKQLHCSDEHRIPYKSDRMIQRRFNKRQQQRSNYITFIDAHGDYIKLKHEHLKPGSMRADLEPHRNPNFDKEKQIIRNQLKTLGLKV